MTVAFPFSDLHSFKDYVGFVKLCSPDEFSLRDGVGPDDQWTLDLAFEGLRLGLRMAAEEKGLRDEFAQGELLVEEAFAAYRDGRIHDGFFRLEELQELLKKIPSR
ncbi:hypothetical protein [Anatilimnocola floriformis]|uniref:hypothetical protein n=1 Tax=Anatilimnocola floriformis TaxID=2948575 RepID=UPI0020C538B2|nr:hypothetical protein [Anatilimnocola floriformis]